MINFATLQGLTIPEGVVTQITDASGRVLWALSGGDEPAAIFEAEKKTKTTYAGETKYENEQFILLDIYPKKGGTVNVTYGGLTKTITDTSGAEEPNAQQVFFGTFNGVSDSVETPASGTLTIEGAYRGYGLGAYQQYANKEPDAYAYCINGVVDLGNPVYIGAYMFYWLTDLALTELPSGLTSIGDYAFYGCENLALTELPSGLTSIGDYAFYNCDDLVLTELPSGLTTIGESAFEVCDKINLRCLPEGVVSVGQNAFRMDYNTNGGFPYTSMNGVMFTLPTTIQNIGTKAFAYTVSSGAATCYLGEIEILAKVPPTATSPFGDYGIPTIIVPAGCGEAYKTAEGWSAYADKIVEAS